MIGVVWLGNRNTTTSKVAHVWSGQGVGLRGESPVLYVREETFALETVLNLLPHHWMGANSIVKSSFYTSLLHPRLLHFMAPMPTPEAWSLRLEESIRRGRG